MRQEAEKLIVKHGGYRNLKSFQVAQLIYDVTVRFAERYVDKFSRTKDQMIQSARSGVQNIAEGSQASGTSKKTELKLTNVARASLEELKLDYEDFLRQKELTQWQPNHPALERFKERRCRTIEDMQAWLEEIKNTDLHGRTRTNTDQNQNANLAIPESALIANAVLSLLNICCHLLDRQLAGLAKAFEQEGGFTERLYQVRQKKRKGGYGK